MSLEVAAHIIFSLFPCQTCFFRLGACMELSVECFENGFEVNWYIQERAPAVLRPCGVNGT